ncbi:hypothetical protein I3I95_00920 [bacterium]|nr:hypothetical protein [bacterium]
MVWHKRLVTAAAMTALLTVGGNAALAQEPGSKASLAGEVQEQAAVEMEALSEQPASLVLEGDVAASTLGDAGALAGADALGETGTPEQAAIGELQAADGASELADNAPADEYEQAALGADVVTEAAADIAAVATMDVSTPSLNVPDVESDATEIAQDYTAAMLAASAVSVGGSDQGAGERQIDGKWYYFYSDGAYAASTFVDLGGRIVYYGADGAMRYGEQHIGDGWYYFDTWDGHMATGLTALPDGRTVCYGADGAMRYGEQHIGDGWYYFDAWDGHMATGLTALPDGRTVCYGADGAMLYGEQHIGDGWYYFDAWDGHMATGLTTLPDGRRVLYGDDGAMRYGEARIGDGWYYFDTWDGHMATGLTALPDGRRVLYGDDGAMRYGEQHIDDAWYYFDTWDGHMATSELTEYDGAVYYHGADGRRVFSDAVIDGVTYHFDATTGALVSRDSESDGNATDGGNKGAKPAPTAGLTDRQQRLISAASSEPCPGPYLCATWVCQAFKRAGLPISLLPTGADYYYAYCTSTDLSDLESGMIIAEDSSYEGGHVGIYVGNDTVISSDTFDDQGVLMSWSVENWIAVYGAKGPVAWGWANGNDLSA